MKSRKTVFIFIFTLLKVLFVLAQDTAYNSLITIDLNEYEIKPFIDNRPDGHSPSGIMAGHTHENGVWMFAYKYMLMNMEGNIQGINSISDESVLKHYMMVPKTMTMQMHMLDIMYGISLKLTLMTMLHFVDKQMLMSQEIGENTTSHTYGLGDIAPSILYDVAEFKRQKIIANIGFHIPAGNINKHGDMTHLGITENVKLPYAMQLGSGTFDLFTRLTYIGQDERTSWGLQNSNELRTGTNREGYRLGNQYVFTAWMAFMLNEKWSTSLRMEENIEGKIKGQDADLSSMMEPASNVHNYGGDRLSGYVGLNYFFSKGILKGSRLSLEHGLPLYQDMNGIQMPLTSQLLLSIYQVFTFGN